MRISLSLAVLALSLTTASCPEEEPEEDPPTKDGDACTDEETCDKGFVCLVETSDEESFEGACKTLPDGCDPEEPCDCATIYSLCPDGGAGGGACLSFFNKTSVQCSEGEGEGEGEGE